jgi:hypothetical protein
MECKAVRLLLPFLPPHAELDAGDAAAVRDHLAGCPDCGALARGERQLDERLGQTMRAVPVPVEAKERLLQRLGAQRRAWYRRRVFAPLAAASVLLAVGLGAWWLTSRGTVLDLELVCHEAANQAGTPPELIERWFAARGVRVPLSRDFNYALLTSYDLVHFQGRDRVARLEFERDGARAWVYVLRAGQFDLKAAAAQEPHLSGGYTVEVWRPDGANYAYLAIYTGGPRAWFLSQRPAGA